ncbi:MAG: SBBP repeat-containing protein [Bryobacteraceae bacterium]
MPLRQPALLALPALLAIPVLAAGHDVWFEENHGQVDARATYFARGRGYNVYVNRSEATLALLGEKPALVTMRLLDTRREASMEGGAPNGDTSSYFIGNDASRWVKAVSHHDSIRVNGAWPGIDVRYYENGRRVLEHDFHVAPHADPARIRFAFDGATPRLDKDGALVLDTAAGPVRWEKPEAYQTIDGARQGVVSAYRLSEDGIVDFALGEYDREAELVIDPELVYARWIGGAGRDLPHDVLYLPALDETVVVGETDSVDIRLVNPLQHYAGDTDAFLLRTRPSGTQQFTYFGGSYGDTAESVAADSSGNLYIGGGTVSRDFPFTGASGGNGYRSGFVMKLSPGGALLYSFKFGGTRSADVTALAVDVAGNVYATGWTQGLIATPGAFQPSPGSDVYTDAFVAKLNPAGSAFIYASHLGGSGADVGTGIAVNGAGEAFVAGWTSSPGGIATPGSLFPSYQGGTWDGFAVRINATGTAKIYGTYFGGPGFDYVNALALDGNQAIIGGITNSANLPVANAIQAAQNGPSDGFVAALTPDGSGVTFSTYYGGSGDDWVVTLDAASVGSIVIGGFTLSPDFPTVDRLQPFAGSSANGFISWLRAAPAYAAAFSTTLGPLPFNPPLSVSVDPANIAGRIYFAGSTSDRAFPADRRSATAPDLVGQLTSSPIADGFYGRITTATGPCTPEIWIEPSATGFDVNFTDAAQTAILKVRSPHNCNWTLHTQALTATWLTIPRTSGTGVDAISITASANTGGALRLGSISVSPGGSSVTVRQSGGCTYAFSPNVLSVPSTGGTASVALNTTGSNCVWSLQSQPLPSWMTLAQTAGQPGVGTAAFSLAVQPNPQGRQRGNILSAGSNAATLEITQAPCSVAGSLPGYFQKPGGLRTLTLTAEPGCPWSLTGPPWLTFSQSTGSGPATIGVTASANPGDGLRDGAIGLGYENGFISVMQIPFDCTFSTRFADYPATYRGGVILIPIEAESACGWVVRDSGANIVATGDAFLPGSAAIILSANETGVPVTRAYRIANSTNSPPGPSFTITQAAIPAGLPVLLAHDAPTQAHNLRVRFADTDGAANLTVLNLLIGPVLDGRGSCYLAYDAAARLLYLVNDAGDALLPAVAVPSAGPLSNSQCAVADVAATHSGNTVLLEMNVAFPPTYAGNKIVYAAARDAGGHNSGWIPGKVIEGAGPATGPYVVRGKTPLAATVKEDTLLISVSDASGGLSLMTANVLINNAIDGRNACYFGYHFPSQSLQLIGDIGSGVAGSVDFTTLSGSAENSQCRIERAGSFEGGPPNRNLYFRVTFKPGFAGEKIVYAGAVDSAQSSGWVPVSALTIAP